MEAAWAGCWGVEMKCRSLGKAMPDVSVEAATADGEGGDGAAAVAGDVGCGATAEVRAEVGRDAPSDAALAVLGEKLLDRSWRLSNLYYVTDKSGERVRFVPNWAQLRLFDSLAHRNVDLKVRQLGVTTGYCILWLDAVLFNRNLRVGIVAHTKDDAMIIFRDKIQFAYDNLPEEIRAAVFARKRDAHEILLNNGSSIRVGVTFRSGTVQVLHVTEYGYICQRQLQRADEIKTGAFQAVPADGIIVVESTAKGRAGHFYELCQGAQKGNDWRFRFLPWYLEPSYALSPERAIEYKHETEYLDKLEGVIGQELTAEQRQWWCGKHRELGSDMFAEYPSTAEEAFRASTEGAYYGSQMLEAWQEKRITAVPVDRALLVDTWWDLGMNDETFLWFVQRNGYEVRLVDCYKNSGEGLPHYAAVLDEWRREHGVVYGRHIAPHDINVRELNTGKSRLETAGGLGIAFEVAPMLPVVDGIEAVRAALSRCVFDEERCVDGIRGLEHYRKEWNEALGVYRNQPLHDWASHPADAFRTGLSCEGVMQRMVPRAAAREIRRERWR